MKLVAVIAAVVVGFVVPTIAFPWFEWSGLLGTDPYMRLARVERWHEIGDWSETVHPRVAWPEGASLHWTRPLDVVLRAGGAALAPWVGFHDGLRIFSYLVNPLCLFLALLALDRTLRRRLDRPRRFALLALLPLQPAVMAYSMAPRIDHHAALFAGLCLAIGWLVRIADEPDPPDPSSGRGRRRRLDLLALLCAALLWVSFEFLVVVVFVVGALWMLWLVDRFDFRPYALRFGGVLTAGLALALTIERGAEGWSAWEIDRLSAMTVVLSLAIVAASSLPALFRPRRAEASRLVRLLLLVVGAAVTVLVFHLVFPTLWRAPLELVDPRIVPIWYAKVEEIQPLVREGRLHFGVLGTIVFVVVAAPFLARRLLERPPDALWTVCAVGAALFVPLTCYQQRNALFAEPFLLLPVVDLSVRLFGWTNTRRTMVARLAVHSLHLTVVMALPVAVSTLRVLVPDGLGREVSNGTATRLAMMDWLATYDGGAPKVVLADIDLGATIVFETPHRVVAAPYHRNGDAIYDGVTFFETADADVARTIALRRGGELVLFEGPPRGWAATPVEWLTPVPLPPGLAEAFTLFRCAP